VRAQGSGLRGQFDVTWSGIEHHGSYLPCGSVLMEERTLTMKLMLRYLCFVAIGIAWPLHAQTEIGAFEEILVPLAFSRAHEVPGAHGTTWSGEVFVHNRSNNTIILRGIDGCIGGCLGPTFAGYTGPLTLSTNRPEYGLLLTPYAELAANLTFSARIFEITRKGQPRGVNIPIVREREFFTRPTIFVAVPAGPDVRVALRLYDPRVPRPVPSSFTVEVLKYTGEPFRTDDLLGTTIMSPTLRNDGNLAAITPGFDIIADLAARFPAINDHAYVNIKVTPQSAGVYWGMVAVTDNDTQTVSIITAQ